MFAAGAYLRLLLKSKALAPNADEGISLLAAACHEADYAEVVQRLRNRWVPASEWRVLIEPARLCLGEIRAGLLATDVHPPLYFWALHLWLLAFGLSTFSGFALNLVFTAGCAVFLHAAARRLGWSRTESLAVAGAWLLSPVAFSAAVEMRPYELLAMSTAAFVWQTSRNADVARGGDRRDLVGLGVATACGLLAHYYFASVIAGSVLFLLIRLGLSRALLRRLVAIGVGGLAAYAVNPMHAVARSGESASPSFVGAAGRSDVVASLVGAFLEPFLPALLLIGVLAAGALTSRLLGKRPPLPWQVEIRTQGASIAVMAIGALLITGGVHALGLVPAHAMAEKYLAHVWPVFALLLVAIVRATPVVPAVAVPLLLGLTFWHAVAHAPAKARAAQVLTHARTPEQSVTIESNNRLHLPRTLFQIAPTSQVFQAYSPQLLAQYDLWTAGMVGDVVWVAPSYGFDPSARAELLRRLQEQGYRVTTRRWHRGSVAIELKPRRARSSRR